MVVTKIRADLQYRASFFLFLTAQMLVTVGELAAIAVIFTNVDALAGWSVAEVALLYGLSSTSFGLGDLFASQVEYVSIHIKAGTFDGFLIRPLGPLLQLSAMEFAPRRVGRLIQPLVVLVIALGRVDVHWTPARILMVPIALAGGFLIYGAIWVLSASLSFWTVETQEIANSFTYGGNTLTSYPIDLFGPLQRRIVVFVVPLAFVAYLPAVYILDKPTLFDFPAAVAWLTPVVACALCALTWVIWRSAIQHYQSTGS
jgi:ABC-2 type transport system permease protein